MGYVDVVDRGSREIVVFLSGNIDSKMQRQLARSLERVARLERLNDLHQVVIDTREVSEFGAVGVRFLRRLEQLGRANDFDMTFAMTSQAVRTSLDQSTQS